MSKKYILDLIQMSDELLDLTLSEISVKDFRAALKAALKEQEIETRHECAAEIHSKHKED